MTTKFEKGDHATLIQRYDGSTWAYSRVIVHSCGAKRMTLAHAASGRLLGRDFYPYAGFHRPELEHLLTDGRPAHHAVSTAVFPGMTDQDARSMCIDLASSHLAYEIKNLRTTVEAYAMDRGKDPYYHAICAQIAKLAAATPTALEL